MSSFSPPGFAPPPCPETATIHVLGFSDTGAFCYTVHESSTWTEAAEFCQKSGVDLSRLTGKDEGIKNLKAVYQHIFYDTVAPCVWVGLSDPLRNGRWRWQDGQSLPITSMLTKCKFQLTCCRHRSRIKRQF